MFVVLLFWEAVGVVCQDVSTFRERRRGLAKPGGRGRGIPAAKLRG